MSNEEHTRPVKAKKPHTLLCKNQGGKIKQRFETPLWLNTIDTIDIIDTVGEITLSISTLINPVKPRKPRTLSNPKVHRGETTSKDLIDK